MPPKNTRKAQDKGEDAEIEDHMVASPLTSEAGSYASSISSAPTSLSLSSAMLESILAATSKSMADSMAASSKSMEASMMSILATLTPAAPAPAPISLPPAKSHVKVPKWSDDEIPFEFFTKLEKALTHNGVEKAAWGQLLPVYLAGKAQAALAQVPVASLDDY